MGSERKKVIKHILDFYNAKDEYLWARYPNFAVFRHSDNRKWFAIIMDIPREKLGIPGKEKVDVLNLKMSDPFTADFLTTQDGIFPGYHISRGNWISVLLDGSVDERNIFALIEESFNVTAKKKAAGHKKQIKEI